MKLVIVESPTKARTISRFLGRDYKVASSFGHIRDLPKSELGIDIDNNFEPRYVIPTKSRKAVTALKKEARNASTVILATDEDREGEAIAWHLTEALGLGNSKFAAKGEPRPPRLDGKSRLGQRREIRNSKLPQVERIAFHEITQSAIKEALENPRNIDPHLVDAQQARRLLDRLVGYLLSPFLWKKIFRGLSAGRVQSVALRLIVEREEEIRNFKPEEYWSIVASLQKIRNQELGIRNFEANLYKINGEVVPKFGIKTQEEAGKIVNDLKQSEFKVAAIEKKEVRKNPLPPFTTSTLQQEANKRLRFSAKQTMRLAQNLYEKGFITYMRTDSVNLSQESMRAALAFIEKELGKKYALEKPNVFRTKSRLAQEAHEAVRPTNPFETPTTIELEDPREKKLYDLIWRRFIASQLPQALFDATRVEVEASSSLHPTPYTLVSYGSILRFDGFLKIWPMKFEERELPALAENEPLELLGVKPEQHFTEPKPRYNEASLVKTLEEYGIGRPSTYAPIISVIQERNYVTKNQDRRFAPTETGELVNKILREHFHEVVDIQFTAHMEEDLDEIAEGKKEWQAVMREFYTPFSKHLEQKYEEVSKEDFVRDEKTDEVCDACGKPMVIKTGRFGKFLACSGFPACKNTKSLMNADTNAENTRQSFGPCQKCEMGEIVMKRTRRGTFFYGCNRYPECGYATWTKPENSQSSKT